MSLTQEQLDARYTQGALGATDIARGVSKGEWYDIWFRYVHGVVAEPSGVTGPRLSANDPAQTGTILEPIIVDELEHLLGPLRRNVKVRASDCPLMVSLDGQVIDTGEPVNAKTSAIHNARMVDHWEAGLPDDYVIQARCEMIATGTRRAYYGALIGGLGWRMYTPEWDDAECDAIRTIVDWMMDLIRRQVPPEGDFLDMPSMETLKRVKRVGGKVVRFDADQTAIVDRWWNGSRATRLGIEDEEDADKRAALTLLGNAEFGALTDGRCLKMVPGTRQHFDIVAFKAAHPDLYAKFTAARPTAGTPTVLNKTPKGLIEGDEPRKQLENANGG